jgi:glycosyltransferase involved in cell wall biosynthesis
MRLMHLGLDLRGLNYAPRTGVNTFTLHFLYELKAALKKSPGSQVTAIGLRPERFEQLKSEFTWFQDLFQDSVSLGEYLGLPDWLLKFNFLGRETFLLNGWLGFKNLIFKSIDNPKIRHFDVLFLPQIKPIIKSPSTRLVVMIHDVYGALDEKLLPPLQNLKEGRGIYSRLLEKADLVWVNSISTGRDVINFFHCHESKLRLVYLALPEWAKLGARRLPLQPNQIPVQTGPEYDLQNQQTPSSKPYCLAISGIEPRKNWHNLLLAHGYLQTVYPDYDLDLVLCGVPVNSVYLKYIQKIIHSNGIQNVRFELSVSEEVKRNLLENALFAVYPSFYEGFGFPILEALAAQKAVLTSNISSMPEIAREAGVYVNPFNYMDIAHGLHLLQTDAKFRASLEQNSRHALELFSWEETGRAIEKLLSGQSKPAEDVLS